MVSNSIFRCIFADLSQNVQLKFLMLTKPDRKEGQRDTGREDRVGQELSGRGDVMGAKRGVGRVAGGHEGLLGVSGAVG